MKTSTVIKNALLGCLLVMTAQVQASLQVGDAAPDWTLEASDGKTYRLSELRGKHVVLAFFSQGLYRRMHHRVQVSP